MNVWTMDGFNWWTQPKTLSTQACSTCNWLSRRFDVSTLWCVDGRSKENQGPLSEALVVEGIWVDLNWLRAEFELESKVTQVLGEFRRISTINVTTTSILVDPLSILQLVLASLQLRISWNPMHIATLCFNLLVFDEVSLYFQTNQCRIVYDNFLSNAGTTQSSIVGWGRGVEWRQHIITTYNDS